jgi:C-terminal peptidase prc
MTKAWIAALGGLLAALALSAPANADTPKPAKAGKSAYVVLVGISKYEDKQIKPRPHAEADAQALHDLFTAKDYLGADPRNVRLLLGDKDAKRNSQPATRANLLKALKWVAAEAGPDDLVIFAFIGQGGPLGESGDSRCYFTADSTFKNRAKDAVAAEEIEEALKPLKSKQFCVFLDVNFKGFTDTSAGPKAIAEPTLGKAPYKEFLGDDGTEDHAPKRGRIAFLATNGLNESLDLKDHGVFTQVIVDGLKGAADKEGYEPDGLVTIDELSRYINKELPALCRKFGKTEKQREQDHFIIGGPSCHYVLTSNPAAAPKAKARLSKLQKLLDDGKVPANLGDEARTLLERMPTLKKKQQLRKVYQQLVDGDLTLEKFTPSRRSILDSMQMRRTDALVFARKVLEVVEIIKEDYVKEVNQGQMVTWAIRELHNYLEEKVPPAVEAKLKNARTLGELALLQLLAEARQKLGKREDLDNNKDLNVTLQRMLHRLDPYTTWIDPESKKKFEEEIDGNFRGIGIQIRKDQKTDQLLVVTPIKDSPAYKAGLQTGDLISVIKREVDEFNKPLAKREHIPTAGLSIEKAVKLIKGQENTPVTLTIVREGKDAPFDVTIKRGLVEVESVLGHRRKANDKWDFMIDKKNKIGYLRLSSFARTSYRDLARAMDDMTRQGVKGFVLDLRFNPGGLLDIAIKITDLYIDDGLIVSIRPRAGAGRETRFNGRHAGSLLDFPMVCLVNGYSASGSEIVSAALQDHKRALIIGERSYGKGSVQNIKEFEQGEIKLTTASFWRPSGKNLNKASTSGKDDDEWGVIPDKAIKLTPKERRDLLEHQRNLETIEPPGKRVKVKAPEFKDRQLDAALEYLRGQIKMASRGSSRKNG